MKKKDFKRITALVLAFVMFLVMLPTVAIAQPIEEHTVQINGTTYNLPSLPTESTSYILLKNIFSKDVTLLVGLDDGYFGSTQYTIWNYDSSYEITDFTSSYVSTFNNTEYTDWTSNDIGNRFSLYEYEIVYKSKPMYPASPDWEFGHIFTTLPEGVSWNDKIIITYSNGAYRLYKPANNNGMWVDVNNINCNFVYRDTLTSENQTVFRYTYDTSTRTWTKGTSGRTEGHANEVFYVSSDVFLANGTVKRAGQRDFYAQSPSTQDDELIYDLSSLLTTNSYILLKNTVSKNMVLLAGYDDGYFGGTSDTIWNYNSSFIMTEFASSYVSISDNIENGGWKNIDIGTSFGLSGYEIVYKSKPIYPASPSWEIGHIFTKLPEGVSWNDKIIITYSNGAYRLYKPANNNGMWVDADNIDCNFVYRDALTSENQTLSRYTYNINARTWTSGTSKRTEGHPSEVFYVGADVFLTDGTVERIGQRDFYASNSELNDIQFEPLEPKEAKEFLNFISNVSENKIEQKLPKYYALLTGTLQNPEEELKVKLSFLTYLYYCLDLQLAKCNERIDIGTTYLINWVEDNTTTSTIIYGEITDEIMDNLQSTIAKNMDIPKIPNTPGILTTILDYGELLIHSIGSILSVRRADDIRYLRVYLKFLEADYNGDYYNAISLELDCSNLIINEFFSGNPPEMRKYAKYIFNIEHSIPSNPLTN